MNKHMNKQKRKKKRQILKILKVTVISLLMMCAATCGILCARWYVKPFDPVVMEYMAEGTLEQTADVSKEKCNILILGTDKDGLRTDVMMLAQIDPINDKVVVMSIPRDTRVKYNGRWRKITEVHAVGYSSAKGATKAEKSVKGSEASIKIVKELTGVPIHYYAKVNFKAFSDCIDELGGVNFNVPQRMYYNDPAQDLYINLNKGMQHLDGDKAEQLVRFRMYKTGDLKRIETQQNFLHAIVEQKLNAAIITKIPQIYNIVVGNMETPMGPEDFSKCGMEVLNIGKDKIMTVTFPGVPKDIAGGSYVIPEYDKLGGFIEEHFGYDENGNNLDAKN